MAHVQGYIILFLIWLASVIFVRAILAKSRTSARLPPSPPALPIIGHLHLLTPITHQALHKLSNRYGPIIHIFLGSVPWVVASSSEMAKEFLQTKEISFSNRPKMAFVDYLTYGPATFVFAPYGAYWKFMKKLCMSQLLGGRTLDKFLPVRQQELKRFLQLMLRKAETSEAVDVGGELMMLSNNIISCMAVRQRCCDNEEEANNVRRIVKESAKLTVKFNLSDFIWFCKNLDLQRLGKRLKKLHDRFDVIIERIIKEHEEARKKEMGKDNEVKDLLDILLNIAEDENSVMKLSRDNIKAFIQDIFVGGTDTSATTIEWALAELINHPNVMEKARREIDFVIGKSRLVEESDIPNLPYLQATIKETLRLHPTVPMILRESSEHCIIGGYEIPAKTRLFVNVWAIGRDPEQWENPLEFKPERFMGGKKQIEVRGQHFQLLPFGSGRRSCPGTSLALRAVQTSLAAMIQCFEWKVDGGNDSVSMDEAPALTLQRAHPLMCVPVTRLNPFVSI